MDIEQIAQAVLNDSTTEQTRVLALDIWIAGHETAAVHKLLPTVFAEMRKPIYEGVEFSDSSWVAAASILNQEIDRAIIERNKD
jgi:hypothetical protein